jgi:hypothetical protein
MMDCWPHDTGSPPAPRPIDTFDTASLSGNGFDAIWQYSSFTELLLRRVHHKHTKGCWINSGFQECVPTWLEGKLVHDGAYTREIFVKPEDRTLVNTPLPLMLPDAGGCIAEGPLLTPQQSEIDLISDGYESLSNTGRMDGIQKENKQEDPKIGDDEVPGALLSLFQQPIDPTLPDYLSSDKDSKKDEAPGPSKIVIPDVTGDLSRKKGAGSEEELATNPPLAGKPSSELKCHMTLEDMWSSKDPGTHKMLEAFLATKGLVPVAPLAPKQLFAGSSFSNLAKKPGGTPNAQDFIAQVPIPFDSTPRNVYHVDGAAIHSPIAGLARFTDEKKRFEAFEKNKQQHYIRGCLESQHHLLRSKTMIFAQRNMKIVNEINDKNTPLKLLTEPTLLGQPFVPRSVRHHTSLNIRKAWEHKKAPQMLRSKIDEIELQTSFEVAAKIRDYVLLEAKYLWEENAPKFSLALPELVSYVSDTIHAAIPSVERWTNVNEKERRMYS